MKNLYLRLFVAQTKLMTAEKMRLDRFCDRGEYFAYKISLPSISGIDISAVSNIDFSFDVDIQHSHYSFSDENIDEDTFTDFEHHLSTFLNELFCRKLEFEKQDKMIESVLEKITTGLTVDERRCLATHIDTKTTRILRALGALKDETD